MPVKHRSVSYWYGMVWYCAAAAMLCKVHERLGKVKRRSMMFGYGRVKQAGAPFGVGSVSSGMVLVMYCMTLVCIVLVRSCNAPWRLVRAEYRVALTRAVSVKLGAAEQCIGGVLCGSVQFR